MDLGKPSSTITPGLALDPGVSRKPRRETSIPLCCAWACGGIVLIIGLCFCGFIFMVAKNMLSNARSPHRELYFNASVTSDTVVQPLVDHSSTFDIAVSVWLRGTDAEEAQLAESSKGQDQAPEKSQIALDNLKLSGKDTEPIDIPLFSDIVFRGMKLSQKNALANVSFKLPTRRFRHANLTAGDLRASFVLLPSIPLANSLANYSSWVPDGVIRRPMRSWPFPLGTPDVGPQTLVDRALDSAGFSIGLVQLFEVESTCGNITQEVADPVTDNGISSPSIPPMEGGSAEELGTTLQKIMDIALSTPLPPPHKQHPFIVTRTKLRVSQEVGNFSLQAYNMAHRKLRSEACGLKHKDVTYPRRALCERNLAKNGPLETQLQLKGPDGNVSWRYAPFLDAQRFAAGPKDYVKVPVHRENCSAIERGDMTNAILPVPSDVDDEEFMDILWRISFSGRSPLKSLVADMASGAGSLVLKPYPVYNDSDYSQVRTQDAIELMNGLLGHRFRNEAYPRRRLALKAISAIWMVIAFLASAQYWRTRSTTAGISIYGSVIDCATELAVVASALSQTGGDSFMLTIFTWLLVSPVLFGPVIFQIRAIMRVQTTWRGVIPIMQRLPPTHRERASTRLDKKTSIPHIAIILATSLAIYTMIHEGPNLYIISPRTPPLSITDLPSHGLFMRIVQIVLDASRCIALILQFLLNYRAKSFAGAYRFAAIGSLIRPVFDLAEFVTAVVGDLGEARGGLKASVLVEYALVGVQVWQASMLPAVLQAEADDGHEL